MSNPKRSFDNDTWYHVFNRGVEKRILFSERIDYVRFIHDMFVFNDVNPTEDVNVRLSKRTQSEVTEQELIACWELGAPNIRKPIVDVLAFCLMPNHYHLLLKQRVEGGITRFMRRLGTGYSMYFNGKYDRVGPLFQGRFKSVPIIQEGHFWHISNYIHLNAVDIVQPGWKRTGVKDLNKVKEFLQTYRWSSFPDYIGERNFPSVTQRDEILNLHGGSKKYEQFAYQWLTKDHDSLAEFNIPSEILNFDTR